MVDREGALESRDWQSPERVAMNRGEKAVEGRRLVLVVDDEPQHRYILVRLFEGWGFRALEAPDGEAAVALANRESLAVIVLDVHMPLLDGLEATRRIRALDGARGSVPIVVLSGGLGESGATVCRAAGADAFLAKPVRARLLEAAVRRAMTSAAP